VLRRSALILSFALLGGCVTNIAAKAAETCRPVPDPWNAECVSKETARLQEKNRETARILAAGLGGAAQSAQPTTARATGFLKSNYVSGFNRICVYNELGSDRVISVGSTELCPLTLP
jgi:hypothetical protein